MDPLFLLGTRASVPGYSALRPTQNRFTSPIDVVLFSLSDSFFLPYRGPSVEGYLSSLLPPYFRTHFFSPGAGPGCPLFQFPRPTLAWRMTPSSLSLPRFLGFVSDLDRSRVSRGCLTLDAVVSQLYFPLDRVLPRSSRASGCDLVLLPRFPFPFPVGYLFFFFVPDAECTRRFYALALSFAL